MKKVLNSNHLKLIAILAMTIDHVADLIFPNFQIHPLAIIMHIIGRLTAPIMFFFIAEGFYYTKNLKKYLIRMFCFAFISHFAYCFAFGITYLPFAAGDIFNQTSIIWPFAWSIVALFIIHKLECKEWIKYTLLILINIITFPSDYSCIAVMAIIAIYANRGNLKKQMIGMSFWIFIYAVVSFVFVDKIYALIQLGIILSFPLLSMYNGERGKCKSLKWLFYIYYPAHLLVVGILRIVFYGDVSILF